MRSKFALALVLLATGCTRLVALPEGHWAGVARFQGRDVAVALDFTTRRDTLRGALSSDALMLLHQPLKDVRWEAGRIRFVIPDVDVPLAFDGVVRADSMQGTLASTAFPAAAGDPPRLLLRRVPSSAPGPETREATFQGQGVTLAGTVFMPEGEGPHPGLVLLQGSSLVTREHYLYYADRFARTGFVTLVFDKRGSGASDGVLREVSYDDLIADAVAAVRFVAMRPDVDSTRVGVWGLSQGAFLAPRVATLGGASFVIAISSPTEPIADVAPWQDSVAVRSHGFAAGDGHRAAEASRRVSRWAASHEGADAIAPLLAEVAREPWGRHAAIPKTSPPERERRGWYWAGRTLDPMPWWSELRVPALVVYGARDPLVPAERNAARLTRLFAERADGVSKVTVFPRANHDIKEFPAPGEPFDWPRAPGDYMSDVVEWAKARVDLSPHPR